MKQIKNVKMGIIALLLMLSIQGFAQKNGENLIGKWQTEDNTVLEVFKSDNVFSIKQLTASKEKEKKNNGKIIAKKVAFTEGSTFKGIVIDPSNNKEYDAFFIVAADGKSLKLKVKWGFINFNETWKKL